jgi:hypothetical protein
MLIMSDPAPRRVQQAENGSKKMRKLKYWKLANCNGRGPHPRAPARHNHSAASVLC